MYARLFLCLFLICFDFVVQPLPAADGLLKPGTADAISRAFLGPIQTDFISPSALGLDFEERQLPNASGATLRVWHFKKANAPHTVLFCMGNQGNISTHLAYTKLLVEGGFNVVMFDYQGYGGSTGTAGALSLYSDTTTVAEDLVTKQKLAPASLASFGVSLGSALAVAVAAKYNFGAVIVEDILLPTKQLDKIAQQLPNDFTSKIALGTIRTVILPQVDPLVTVKKLQCPLLIMHGERDPLLPPAGSIELASTAACPTRMWLMSEAGHAPETLEIYDGEYALQVQNFLRSVFAGKFTPCSTKLTVTSHDKHWLAKVQLTCSEPGYYQIALASVDGKFHFLRREVSDALDIELELEFVPVHASAIKFHNARPTEGSSWQPIKSSRSQALADYRSLAERFAKERPFASRMALYFGALRPARYRTSDDLRWLQTHFPEASSVHSDVRPRYARLYASAFGGLSPQDQAEQVEMIEHLLPYLPDEPLHYFQLENAGFELQLRDEQLAGVLMILAKHRFDQGELAEARKLLELAYRVTQQPWPKREGIEQLKLGDDFYKVIGSPY